MEAFMNAFYSDTGLMVVKTIVTIFKYLIPIIVLILLARTDWNDYFKDVAERTEANISLRLKEQQGYFSFTRIADYLKSHGMDYSLGDLSTPFMFIMAKIICAFVLLLLGITILESLKIDFGITTILTIIITSVFGFFLPDLIINLFDGIDNDEMLMDIKSIFDTLRIQTKSGVYLTYSLCECYMIVENPRLKQALLDMTSKIVAKNQIEEAVMEFNSKFNNSYIDTLCITILQSMESGKSSKILDDLAKQISDMQRAINVKEQAALDRRVQLSEVLIFIGAVVALVYVLGTSVMSSLMTF